MKMLARRVLEEELAGGLIDHEELSDFDRKVEALALLAFDVYMRCRENLFEVRMTELKNRTNRLLKLVGNE